MKIFVTIYLILLSLPSLGQFVYDETYQNTTFFEFKNQLTHAILTEDTILLKKLLHDTIIESNDGCGNIGCSKSDFLTYYFSPDIEKETWLTFKSLIRYGFYSENDTAKNGSVQFVSPSYLSKINPDKEVLILAKNVNVRKKPGLNSKILFQSSFEKYFCHCNIIDAQNSTIQTVDGVNWLELIAENGSVVGYVDLQFTSYSIEKELTVEKIKGKWVITRYYHGPGC